MQYFALNSIYRIKLIGKYNKKREKITFSKILKQLYYCQKNKVNVRMYVCEFVALFDLSQLKIIIF